MNEGCLNGLPVNDPGPMPGMARAWVVFGVAGGLVTIKAAFNVAAVIRSTTGTFTIRLAKPFKTANFAVLHNCTDGTRTGAQVLPVDAGSVSVGTGVYTVYGAFDPTYACVACYGEN